MLGSETLNRFKLNLYLSENKVVVLVNWLFNIQFWAAPPQFGESSCCDATKMKISRKKKVTGKFSHLVN